MIHTYYDAKHSFTFQSMKTTLIGLITGCCCSITVSLAQNTVGTLINSAETFNGYTLLAAINSQQTYLIDNCGREIKRWDSNYQMGMAAYLSEDGSLYRAGRIINNDMMMGGIGGVIERYDWDGNLTWQYFCSSTDSVAHHDFKLLPNGNILLLVAYKKSFNDAVANGRDPSLLVDSTLFSEAILEIQPIGSDSATVVWRWDAWDHLIQDFDSTRLNFGVIADHPNRMNINYLGSSIGRDWLHGNSVDYNPQLNQIVIGFRHINEFWIIDHSTTTVESSSSFGGIYQKGGDLLYRWGNPATFNRGTQLNQVLIGQHKVEWIPQGYRGGGNIVLFNNGDNNGYSIAMEVKPPMVTPEFYTNAGTNGYGPDLPEWEYTDSSNPLFNSGRLSSVKRLPNGNTLICSGQNGYLTELDSLNNITWLYRNPVTSTGIISQGNTVQNGVNSIFNASKYSPEYPAFIGKTLVASDPIELNFNLSNCEIAHVVNEPMEEFDWVTLFPNPSSDELSLDALFPIKSVSLMDFQGKQLPLCATYLSLMTVKIDIENIPPGSYIMYVTNELGYSKKLLFNKL
jgi:hypothetical protein